MKNLMIPYDDAIHFEIDPKVKQQFKEIAETMEEHSTAVAEQINTKLQEVIEQSVIHLPRTPFIRAKQDQKDKTGADIRWFHLKCWTKNPRTYVFPHDFPKQAKSNYTRCHGCHRPINEEVSNG